MPHDRREVPIVIDVTGERARHLAERLLKPRAPADRLWRDIAALGGPARRVDHDWDPVAGRLTLVAGGGPAPVRPMGPHVDLARPPSTRRLWPVT